MFVLHGCLLISFAFAQATTLRQTLLAKWKKYKQRKEKSQQMMEESPRPLSPFRAAVEAAQKHGIASLPGLTLRTAFFFSAVNS